MDNRCCPPPPSCPPPPPCCPCPPPCPKPRCFCSNSLGCSLLKSALIFGAGLYTGIYVAQNYDIDKVEDPKVLFEKARTYWNETFDTSDKKKSK